MALEVFVKLLATVWFCSVIAFAPISLAVTYGESECLEGMDVEHDILRVTAIATLVLFCCACWVHQSDDYDIDEANTATIGLFSLWAIDAMIGSVALFRIYSNFHGQTHCGSLHEWAFSGLIVGCIILGLFGCFCCLSLIGCLAGSASDDEVPVRPKQTEIEVLSHRTERIRDVLNNTDRKPDVLGNALTANLSEQEQRILISLALVEKAGFCVATEQNRATVLNKLRTTICSGQTALRDATVSGINKMLALKAITETISIMRYKFVHIVLTDGMDNQSNSTPEDLAKLFLVLGLKLGDFCKTFFVGVDLGADELKELAVISAFGGNSCELLTCDDAQISDIFERIKIRLGIRRDVAFATNGQTLVAAESRSLMVSAEREKFFVLFTLDRSGSMYDTRWNKVCVAVERFLNELSETDIFGCILFNDQVTCITE